jgi:phosphoribosylformimino-5-aminoimidazole carboxamide ribotide isomerase
MIIYPAIDLIKGSVVRLHKGDFDQQTTYDNNPVDVALSYRGAGAQWLHLVDLDGAKNPQNRQTKLIADIISASGLQVQTGGGIRERGDVAALLAAGASRIVIGSLAVRDMACVKALFAEFGAEKICLAADVMQAADGYNIAVSGWQEKSQTPLFEFLESYADVGLKHVLCTDIDRDGTMTGCNVGLYEQIRDIFGHIQLQASGGVSNLHDLRALSTDGVIIGKALYEGAFSLGDALEIGKNAGKK